MVRCPRGDASHGRQPAVKPCPPIGEVTTRSLKPAINGLPRAMASRTAGSCRDASWLALLSPTSGIQMAFASFGWVATTYLRQPGILEAEGRKPPISSPLLPAAAGKRDELI